jgi:hypothetical protein
MKNLLRKVIHIFSFPINQNKVSINDLSISLGKSFLINLI